MYLCALPSGGRTLRAAVGANHVSTFSCSYVPCRQVAAPSGRQWALDENRFLSLECLFDAGGASHAGSKAPATGPAGSPGALGAMEVLRECAGQIAQSSWPDMFAAVLPVGIGGSLAGLRQRLEHELRLLRNEPGMPRMLRPVVVELDIGRQPIVPAPASGGVDGSLQGAELLAAYPLTNAETLAWRGAAKACTSAGKQARLPARFAGKQGWLYASFHRRSPIPSTRSAMKAGGSAAERWEKR